MITTTCLIAVQCRYVKGLPVIAGIAFFLTFGFFDGKCMFVRHASNSINKLSQVYFGGLQ